MGKYRFGEVPDPGPRKKPSAKKQAPAAAPQKQAVPDVEPQPLTDVLGRDPRKKGYVPPPARVRKAEEYAGRGYDEPPAPSGRVAKAEEFATPVRAKAKAGLVVAVAEKQAVQRAATQEWETKIKPEVGEMMNAASGVPEYISDRARMHRDSDVQYTRTNNEINATDDPKEKALLTARRNAMDRDYRRRAYSEVIMAHTAGAWFKPVNMPEDIGADPKGTMTLETDEGLLSFPSDWKIIEGEEGGEVTLEWEGQQFTGEDITVRGDLTLYKALRPQWSLKLTPDGKLVPKAESKAMYALYMLALPELLVVATGIPDVMAQSMIHLGPGKNLPGLISKAYGQEGGTPLGLEALAERRTMFEVAQQTGFGEDHPILALGPGIVASLLTPDVLTTLAWMTPAAKSAIIAMRAEAVAATVEASSKASRTVEAAQKAGTQAPYTTRKLAEVRPVAATEKGVERALQSIKKFGANDPVKAFKEAQKSSPSTAEMFANEFHRVYTKAGVGAKGARDFLDKALRATHDVLREAASPAKFLDALHPGWKTDLTGAASIFKASPVAARVAASKGKKAFLAFVEDELREVMREVAALGQEAAVRKILQVGSSPRIVEPGWATGAEALFAGAEAARVVGQAADMPLANISARRLGAALVPAGAIPALRPARVVNGKAVWTGLMKALTEEGASAKILLRELDRVARVGEGMAPGAQQRMRLRGLEKLSYELPAVIQPRFLELVEPILKAGGDMTRGLDRVAQSMVEGLGSPEMLLTIRQLMKTQDERYLGPMLLRTMDEVWAFFGGRRGLSGLYRDVSLGVHARIADKLMPQGDLRTAHRQYTESVRRVIRWTSSQDELVIKTAQKADKAGDASLLFRLMESTEGAHVLQDMSWWELFRYSVIAGYVAPDDFIRMIKGAMPYGLDKLPMAEEKYGVVADFLRNWFFAVQRPGPRAARGPGPLPHGPGPRAPDPLPAAKAGVPDPGRRLLPEGMPDIELAKQAQHLRDLQAQLSELAELARGEGPRRRWLRSGKGLPPGWLEKAKALALRLQEAQPPPKGPVPPIPGFTQLQIEMSTIFTQLDELADAARMAELNAFFRRLDDLSTTVEKMFQRTALAKSTRPAGWSEELRVYEEVAAAGEEGAKSSRVVGAGEPTAEAFAQFLVQTIRKVAPKNAKTRDEVALAAQLARLVSAHAKLVDEHMRLYGMGLLLDPAMEKALVHQLVGDIPAGHPLQGLVLQAFLGPKHPIGTVGDPAGMLGKEFIKKAGKVDPSDIRRLVLGREQGPRRATLEAIQRSTELLLPAKAREAMASRLDDIAESVGTSAAGTKWASKYTNTHRWMLGLYKASLTTGRVFVKPTYLINNVIGDNAVLYQALGAKMGYRALWQDAFVAAPQILAASFPRWGATAAKAVGLPPEVGLGVGFAAQAGMQRTHKFWGRAIDGVFNPNVNKLLDAGPGIAMRIDGVDHTWADLAKVMDETGVKETYATHELLAEIREAAGKFGVVKKYLEYSAPAVAEEIAMRSRVRVFAFLLFENNPRLIAAGKRALSPQMIGRAVKEVRFDYTNFLTPFERTWFSGLFRPFWAWEKNNLVFQFNILARPESSVALKVGKAINEPAALGKFGRYLDWLSVMAQSPSWRMKNLGRVQDAQREALRQRWLSSLSDDPEVQELMREDTIHSYDPYDWLRPDDRDKLLFLLSRQADERQATRHELETGELLSADFVKFQALPYVEFLAVAVGVVALVSSLVEGLVGMYEGAEHFGKEKLGLDPGVPRREPGGEMDIAKEQVSELIGLTEAPPFELYSEAVEGVSPEGGPPSRRYLSEILGRWLFDASAAAGIDFVYIDPSLRKKGIEQFRLHPNAGPLWDILNSIVGVNEFDKSVRTYEEIARDDSLAPNIQRRRLARQARAIGLNVTTVSAKSKAAWAKAGADRGLGELGSISGPSYEDPAYLHIQRRLEEEEQEREQ